MRKYDHSKIEKKWQQKWQKSKIYKTSDSTKKKKFYVLDMFPYPSGEGLHVGHPKGYIATDIISRMMRMKGMNVLHPMGFDAFGLPAENYAIKTKTNPQIAVKKNVARFKKQLEILGLDYDWSREVNTTDPKFYKWTQWIFLKLLEKGLAYESNEPVNWCPVDKTVLANEDVENGKCERCGALVEKRPIRQWVLKITKYADRLLKDLDTLDWPESIKESQRNWIGRSEGAEINFEIRFENGGKPGSIPVFTTRADTLYGVSALVLSPEHLWVKLALDENHSGVLNNADEVRKYIESVANKSEIDRTDLQKEKTGIKLEGVHAINPANGESVPVFVADYVLQNYGTGAVMSVPANDERDFEFAKKYNLPVKYTVIPKMIDESNPHVPGKKLVFREAVIVILKNPKTNEVLTLKWKKQPWTTFVMGGVEDNESPTEAAERELKEESGYKNFKLVKKLGPPTQTEFFAAHKDVNRIAQTWSFVFELLNEEKNEISKEESDTHELVWVKEESIDPKKMTHVETPLLWDRMQNGEKAFTGEGIVINSGEYNNLTSQEVREKITEKFGKKVIKYKLRDWVFSRQRYWGEPIPVLHDENGNVIPLTEKDLPVALPTVKKYEPTGTSESPLANIKNWVNVKVRDPKTKKFKIVRRETNTMPQWAGSSWYYLRYMDPKNNKKLVDPKIEKYWNQVDFYVGGAEHATRHLIYARFWHKFLYDIGVVFNKEPFKKLQSVGLIMGPDGRKMSKRYGNVINPDDIVKTWGADSLRLYEMFMGPFSESIPWSTENIIGVRRFIEKVWRISEKIGKQKISKEEQKNLEKILHQTIKKVSEDIASMSFNTAISQMMIMANELEKVQSIPKAIYETFITLLSPFAPHVAEEIWNTLGHKKSIHIENWPKFNPKLAKENEVSIAIQINGKVRGILVAPYDSDEAYVKERGLNLDDVKKWVEGKNIIKIIFVKNRILNVVLT